MCDVACVPSTNSTESWGMWQAESLLCGTPVVTTDLPGVRDVVRLTGMGELVRPHDPAALAGARAKVLGEPQRYTQPRHDLERLFCAERTIDAYERWYTQLVDGDARQPPADAPALQGRAAN
jgi:glycosyltransferase involved in cell wall biosynthesis